MYNKWINNEQMNEWSSKLQIKAFSFFPEHTIIMVTYHNLDEQFWKFLAW